MKKLLGIAMAAVLAGSFLSYGAGGAANPRVKIETSKGDIVVELYPKAAPKTVANFIQYVKDGFYDGTIFHRVIKSFMIQGGGFTKDMQEKTTRPPVINEADNGLKNTLGTLAMARTPDPNSATAQFFINAKDNAFLNFRSKDPDGWGYCVFGKVVSGMNVVTSIENEPTGGQDVPQAQIVITKASVVEPAVKPAAAQALKPAVKDTASQKAK
jgi:cyclophilin family peptidyl-prolyl cis-trans isomerase